MEKKCRGMAGVGGGGRKQSKRVKKGAIEASLSP